MDSTGRILYLSRADVEACNLGADEIIAAVERMLERKAKGQVRTPLKPTIHVNADYLMDAIPCYVDGDSPAAGVKCYAANNANHGKGLPAITGLVILNDPATGVPVSIMDCTWITGWRTAAVSAVAAKHLARPGSTVLAILGIGVQGSTHLDALPRVLDEVTEIRVHGTSPDALDAFVADAARRHPALRVVAAASAREAFRGADVVVTASSMALGRPPVTGGDWLDPGVLWLIVSPDRYFSLPVILECDKLLTDDRNQLEQHADAFGLELPIHGELGQVVAGEIAGRTTADERIASFCPGTACADLATAPLVHELAVKKGLGTWLDL